MPIIEWTKEFSIGNPELDAQHKKWFSIYNQAHDRMMDPGEENFITTGIDSLKEMKAYGEYHFSMEEEAMAAIGFPELERHKMMHCAFSREIEGMIKDLESGNHVLNSEVIKRIENWLRHHILNEDQRFRIFSEQENKN